jgi:hypothetical protein
MQAKPRFMLLLQGAIKELLLLRKPRHPGHPFLLALGALDEEAIEWTRGGLTLSLV